MLNTKGRINSKKLKKLKENKYSNIKSFLFSRYQYVDCIEESIHRIQLHYEDRPICPICGKNVKYLAYSRKTNKIYYNTCCSKKCAVKLAINKGKKTCIEKYGVDNTLKLKEVREKAKKTCIERYGVESYAKTNEFKEKIKETCLDKYGVPYYFQTSEFKKRAREKCIEKYGVDNSFKSIVVRNKFKVNYVNNHGVDNPWKDPLIKKKIKNTFNERYGVDSYSKTSMFKKFLEENKESLVCNRDRTKQKNHTFNTSKPEEELYLYIKKKFPEVRRQYKDKERYPYCCDFYIPSLDLFLELNGMWTHGGHPYDSNSINDQNKLKIWTKKDTKFYNNAIKCWTIRDVHKREIAKKNNLNYKEVWSLEEGKKFIDELSCQHRTND